MTTTPTSFDHWCLVEIMGHQRYAGRVTEETLGGTSFLRIEIPAQADGTPAFTKLFSPASVYAITPMAEDLVRGVAAELRSVPITPFDLPLEMRALLTAKPPTLINGSRTAQSSKLYDDADDADDDDYDGSF